MPTTLNGRNAFASRLIGLGDPFNSNSFIAVGNGTTAFHQNQTAIQGNDVWWKQVESSPILSGTSMSYRVKFERNEANFAWNEWALFNGNPTGSTMLVRKVGSFGTKPSTQSWDVTFIINLSILVD